MNFLTTWEVCVVGGCVEVWSGDLPLCTHPPFCKTMTPCSTQETVTETSDDPINSYLQEDTFGHEAAETLEPSGQEDQPDPMGPSVLSFHSTTRRRNPSVDTRSKLGGVVVKELIDSKM